MSRTPVTKTAAGQSPRARNSSLLTAFGETKKISEWARDARCIVSLSALRLRIGRGWEPEEALTVAPYAVWAPTLSREITARTPHRFAVLLRARRLQRRLTLEHVAKQSGYSWAALSLFERGHRQAVSLSTLEAWAEALDMRLTLTPVDPPTGVHLSRRERQVLELIAQGLESQEIAERLGIGERTARDYRKTLYKALGARSGGHAVALGYQYGLLPASGAA
jgi:DNA-binding CsgD family transcriptional regulator/DNA-binding Xre family transcriptional regulator